MKFQSVLMSLLFAAATLLGPAAMPAEAVKMVRISPMEYPASPFTQAQEQTFKKILEDSGLFKVIILPAASLGSAESEFQAVMGGSCNIATNSTGNLATVDPLWAAVDMPFMITNREQAAKIFGGNGTNLPESEVAKKMAQPFVDKGGKILAVTLTNTRYFAFINPFKNVEDTLGRKIRVTTSPSHIAAINAMGYNAVPIASSELITSIQQGVVDGHDPSIDGWYVNFPDMEKYVMISNHLPCFYVTYTSQKFWDSLTEQERTVMEEAVKAFKTVAPANMDAANAKMLPQREAEGAVYYTPTNEEIARWRNDVQKVVDGFSPEVQGFIKEIEADLAK